MPEVHHEVHLQGDGSGSSSNGTSNFCHLSLKHSWRNCAKTTAVTCSIGAGGRLTPCVLQHIMA